MSHSEVLPQIDAYLDGELASADAQEVEVHLKECSDCARFYQARVALSSAIREQVPRWNAPEGLRQRIRAALQSAVRDSTSRRLVVASGWTWLALAASLAVVALGSWRIATDRAADNALGDQLLASHLRSLMPGHLTDVVSSDQHTVKPWFNGRLDFSPPVYDFAGQGFPLLGARLDYVGGRSVAALVYGRRKHLINVFLWPAAGGAAPTHGAVTRQGYHFLHWSGPGYVYWVVSDLGSGELGQFARLLQQADSLAATTAAP